MIGNLRCAALWDSPWSHQANMRDAISRHVSRAHNLVLF
jgi:hypothetical protein